MLCNNISIYRVFPESARWLALNGRRQEACEILLKFGGKNGKTLNEATIMDALETTADVKGNQHDQNMLKRLVDLFKAKKVRKRIIIVSFLW